MYSLCLLTLFLRRYIAERSRFWSQDHKYRGFILIKVVLQVNIKVVLYLNIKIVPQVNIKAVLYLNIKIVPQVNIKVVLYLNIKIVP